MARAAKPGSPGKQPEPIQPTPFTTPDFMPAIYWDDKRTKWIAQVAWIARSFDKTSEGYAWIQEIWTDEFGSSPEPG